MTPKCGLEIMIQIGADRNGRPKYIDYFQTYFVNGAQPRRDELRLNIIKKNLPESLSYFKGYQYIYNDNIT